MRYYSSFLLLMFVSINLWGQNQQCQNLGWNSNHLYSDVPIDVPSNIHNLVNYNIANTQIKVRIALEKDGVFPYGKDDDFDLTFDLLGGVKDMQGNTVLNAQGTPAIIGESITLSEDKSEAIFSINIPSSTTIESANPYGLASNTMYVLSNLEITGVGIATNTTIPANFQDNIIVEVCHEMDLKVDVGTTGATANFSMIEPQLRGIPTNVNGAPYYDFEWDAVASAPTPSFDNRYSPFYEFQLLKLENTELLAADRDDEKHIKTIVDWSKALKFVVPEEKLSQNGYYKLRFRPSEGKGYYLWRVRPIGNYYEGGVAQNLNWGKWSAAGYPVSSGYTVLKSSTSFDCFYYEDPNEEDNYIYSRAFTENGQVYESMTYADKLLRPRQIQSYLPNEDANTPGKTIVGQTLYDHLGRSSISVMPVPVDGYMDGYKDKFVKNTSNELYTIEDYGIDGKLYNPEKISTNGAYQYYSNDNVNDPTVPDAEGYPFSRTIYSNDGLSRVKEQSGVGKTHMVGTRSAGRGRTTTTEVQVGVVDAELVSVFGVEAPNPDNVIKQIVTDPNGTTSITYTSKSGKVLATALAEPYDPDNDYPLSELDHQRINALHLTENLDLGQFQGNRFSNSKTMILAQDAPAFEIDYKAPGCGGAMNNLPTCLSSAFSGCSYYVTVTILKITSTGNEPVGTNPIFQSPKTTVSGCTPVHIATLNLPKGNYKVIKEVEIGGNNITTLINDYQAQAANQVSGYMALVGLLLDQVQIEDDWLKVDLAVDDINAYLHTSSARDAAAQAILQTALNGHFSNAFDLFDFSTLDAVVGSFGEVVIGMEYEPNLSPVITGFPNQEMDEIKLILRSCNGDREELTSKIEKKKNKFNLSQNGPYIYEPLDHFETVLVGDVNYDFPPFVEYFLDQAGQELYDSDPAKFEKFFNGYKYWGYDITNAKWDWLPIGAQFIVDYRAAVSANNTDALKILNANQFNRMVWHMLNDEYYTGQVRLDDVVSSPTYNKYVYYDEVAEIWKDFLTDQNSLNTTQYKVGDLTQCWKSLVGVFGAMVDHSGAITAPGDFDGTINDDTPSGSDNYGDLKNNIPWIINFLFGNKINQAMDNTTSGGGVQPFDNLSFSPSHLPKQFLECSGTKYARIIGFTEENGVNGARTYVNNASNPHGPTATMNFNTYDVPLIGDQSTSTKSLSINGNYTKGGITIPGYTDEINEYYGVYGTGVSERLDLPTTHTDHVIEELPFVQNPVFAFKYYEYWMRTNTSFPHPWDGMTWDNGDPVIPLVCTLNVSTTFNRPLSCVLCEEGYGYNKVVGTCSPSSIGHDEWPDTRRSKFLDCVKNISNASGIGYPQGARIVCSTFNTNSSTLYIDGDCSESQTEIANEVATMVTNCETSCEGRRDEFRKEVIEMFERACWAVGECSTQNVNFVTTLEVEAVVDQLIEECKGQCSLQVPPLSSFTPVSCVSNIAGVTIEYCNVPELDKCELLLRDIAQHWKIELHIDPPVGVTCTGNEWSDPVPSASDKEVCDPVTGPNYYIDKTKEVSVTIPSNP